MVTLWWLHHKYCPRYYYYYYYFAHQHKACGWILKKSDNSCNGDSFGGPCSPLKATGTETTFIVLYYYYLFLIIIFTTIGNLRQRIVVYLWECLNSSNSKLIGTLDCWSFRSSETGSSCMDWICDSCLLEFGNEKSWAGCFAVLRFFLLVFFLKCSSRHQTLASIVIHNSIYILLITPHALNHKQFVYCDIFDHNYQIRNNIDYFDIIWRCKKSAYTVIF